MRFSISIPIFALSVIISTAFGTPITVNLNTVKRMDYAVFEQVQVPTRWTRSSRAPSGHMLDLRIALKQARQAELEQSLYEISDPDHHKYGQHLSLEQINELISPLEESVSAVREWLADNGVHPHQFTESPARDWVSFSIPVEQAESLLDTQYDVYRHEGTGDQLVRTDRYSLPLGLHKHVDLVAPSVYFGGIKAQKAIKQEDFYPGTPVYTPRSDGDLKGCNASAVTSGCLRAYYNTYDYVPKVPTKNSLGVTGYLNEQANYADLQNFLTTERPEAAAANYKFNVTLINGGFNNQTYTADELTHGSGEEANLDVQTAGGFIYPTEYTFYSTGGSPPIDFDTNVQTNTNEPYLDFLNYVLAQKSLPSVFTTSYSDDEQTVPKSYAYRVCSGFAQLGARGISVIFSSGDNGVGPNGTCYANDGKNTSTFIPNFPPSCPFVTTVGATQSFSPEVAVNRSIGGYFSGAGFSNYFLQPPYQTGDVISYLAKSVGTQFKGLFNPFGRAYPDVSAQGARYLIAYNGKYYRIGGTSASTPAFSSIITLLNDYRLSQGKPALGFLNPWLYSKGREGLNDIIQGHSTGCDTSGFTAAPGWDPVTGLGTPDFAKLQKLV